MPDLLFQQPRSFSIPPCRPLYITLLKIFKYSLKRIWKYSVISNKFISNDLLLRVFVIILIIFWGNLTQIWNNFHFYFLKNPKIFLALLTPIGFGILQSIGK